MLLKFHICYIMDKMEHLLKTWHDDSWQNNIDIIHTCYFPNSQITVVKIHFHLQFFILVVLILF